MHYDQLITAAMYSQAEMRAWAQRRHADTIGRAVLGASMTIAGLGLVCYAAHVVEEAYQAPRHTLERTNTDAVSKLLAAVQQSGNVQPSPQPHPSGFGHTPSAVAVEAPTYTDWNLVVGAGIEIVGGLGVAAKGLSLVQRAPRNKRLPPVTSRTIQYTAPEGVRTITTGAMRYKGLPPDEMLQPSRRSHVILARKPTDGAYQITTAGAPVPMVHKRSIK